ncbi:MAG TPA: TolC family protein [Terriglobales bacterium]|nr:TolC family protein [Terriglobales bacterium]
MKLARKIPALILPAMLTIAAVAQQAGPGTSSLTLEGAVDYALSHYPAIRSAMERRTAARGGIGLARTAYLPTANALWQGNRATRNNIFGLLLPQSEVPSISGPVLTSTSNRGVWGSAAGLLVSWEPFDFGYRRAEVDVARAHERVASSTVEISRLDVGAAAANAFLAVVAAQQQVRAAQADVDRRQVFSRVVHNLVNNQLRPGADASRSDAELAAARIALIQAQVNERVGRAELADLLGLPAANLVLDAAPVLQVPPVEMPGRNVAFHPEATAQNARVQETAAQARAAGRSYYPRFNLQGSISGRGTGANLDGSFAGGTTGLDMQRENWAAGLTASFPVLDIFSIRERKQIAEADERAEAARYQQTLQDLSAQVAEAQARLEGAVAIAQATPAELQSARESESQARARYQAALANIVEVTEAQSLLVRAETDDAVAKLNAWRSLAALAVAQGDINPFLKIVRAMSKGGR